MGWLHLVFSSDRANRKWFVGVGLRLAHFHPVNQHAAQGLPPKCRLDVLNTAIQFFFQISGTFFEDATAFLDGAGLGCHVGYSVGPCGEGVDLLFDECEINIVC